jgi:hypothetical protein
MMLTAKRIVFAAKTSALFAGRLTPYDEVSFASIHRKYAIQVELPYASTPMDNTPHNPISLGALLRRMMGIFNAKTTNTKAVNPAPVDLLIYASWILMLSPRQSPLTESCGEIRGLTPSVL